MKYRLRNNYSQDPEKALKEILVDRGVKDVQKFLSPSKACEYNPYDLKNINEAADLLLYHLRKDSSILIVVDADCDGYTSSAILWLYIKHIFPNAQLEFTVHTHKQHGLDDKIDWIENECRWDLVICPDAASYNAQEQLRLGQLGMDFIAIDHHSQEYDSEGNPIVPITPTAIIVNNQLSPDYPDKALCGAGMVYKFCEVLDNKLGISQAHNYIDLAALGEIADVMDRTYTETNYIIMEGLKNIRNDGFKSLIEAQSYSLKDKAIAPYEGLTAIDIAFYIAPLINAITRVGTIEEKEAMFYCFIEPFKELPSTKRGAAPGETETAAEKTARIGKNAKARQDRIKEQALSIIDFKIQKDSLTDNNIIFVEVDGFDNIPQELTGLIAMNVVSKYHKPVMIGRRNSNDEVQGSIRSDGNFAGLPSFKKFLEESGLTTYTAGHDSAAGFGVKGNRIESLLNYANTHLKASDFENCYVVDYILDGTHDNKDLLKSLVEHPEYFGNHIDEIKFVVENIPLMSVMPMGANKDSMKISYNGIDYVRFKDTEFVEQVMEDRTKLLTIYGRGNLNTFNGRTSVQIFIDDYELKEDNSKYDF